jgi:cell division protein ZipA
MPGSDRPRPEVVFGDLFLTTSGESEARAARLLPTCGSEDASELLEHPSFPRGESTREEEDDADTDYLPEPLVEWVVDATFADGVDIEDLARLRDDRKALGGFTFYGRPEGGGAWTFVYAADSPSRYTALKLAWRYVPLDESEDRSAASFDKRLAWASRTLRDLGAADVRAEIHPARAAARVEALTEILERGDGTVVVVVNASDGAFAGRDVWDVMLSLGLRWGDMDLFHLDNPGERGDDAVFSVETSSPPGYFLPEVIAEGRFECADLVFSFSVARCADPVAALDLVLRAAHYAAERLGGALSGDEGPLDEAALRAEVAERAAELTKHGLAPGEDATLMLF